MQKDVILQFTMDEELLDELIKRDVHSKLKKGLVKEEGVYKYEFPLEKDSWSIRENGLLYISDFIALDMSEKGPKKTKVYKTADLEIDTENFVVKKNGEIIRIYPTTYYILEAFMRAPFGLVPRKTLVKILEMKNGKMIQDNTLNQHINRTKKALGTYNGKNYISTLYEIGYRWNFPVEVKTRK